MPPNKAVQFYNAAEEVLSSKTFRDYGIKNYFHGNMIRQDVDIGGYGIRNIGLTKKLKYPLTLDFDNEPVAIHVGSCLTVPPNLVQVATDAIDSLTKILYEIGGKHYLYSYHSLKSEHLEKHYGRDTLDKWQSIKDQHDPKHLLNIGVIEHMDD